MASGIVSWAAYLPYHRLDRQDIGRSLGAPSGRGTRTVASYDEDTTSMAVEAARGVLGADAPELLVFSTASPAYADKTNATAIHAALGLGEAVPAYDVCGSVRSAWAAVGLAMAAPPALIVVSDIRTGLPGSADERDGGDGAVAFLTGTSDAVVDTIGMASASGEFLDRWRQPGDDHSTVWEERFGEQAYVPLAMAACTDAIKAAGIGPEQIDHLIVAGLHGRAARAVAGKIGVTPVDLSAATGNLGAAQLGVALADVLDRAAPGETIALVLLADGADVAIMRTTPALPAAQAARRNAGLPTVADQVAAGRAGLPYATFLTWRGHLHRDPPRRPDPERPAAPPAFRNDEWKFGFNASRCLRCGTRHLPPTRVCLKCHAVDEMQAERLADVRGTIATFTIDHLAYSLSPPLVAVVVDFDGGGRFSCEMTDVDPAAVAIGGRVEMTFRRLFTAGGVHNYFWKARPERSF